LHRNEWHQKYYELFYRKRPGKKRRMSDDLDMSSASLSQFISQNYANEFIPQSTNPSMISNALAQLNLPIAGEQSGATKTEPSFDFPTLLEFKQSPMQITPVSSSPVTPNLSMGCAMKSEPAAGVQLNA
jgi:hypothetical protein